MQAANLFQRPEKQALNVTLHRNAKQDTQPAGRRRQWQCSRARMCRQGTYHYATHFSTSLLGFAVTSDYPDGKEIVVAYPGGKIQWRMLDYLARLPDFLVLRKMGNVACTWPFWLAGRIENGIAHSVFQAPSGRGRIHSILKTNPTSLRKGKSRHNHTAVLNFIGSLFLPIPRIVHCDDDFLSNPCESAARGSSTGDTDRHQPTVGEKREERRVCGVEG